MARRKATIIESSSDESASGNVRKKPTRTSTSHNTRSTRLSTRNEQPTTKKVVAPQPTIALTSTTSTRQSKRILSEGTKTKESKVVQTRSKKDLEKQTSKTIAINNTKSEPKKAQEPKQLQATSTSINATVKKGRKGTTGKSNGSVKSAEDVWLYPNLLDTTSAATDEPEDMDLDKPYGYVLQYVLRAHSRATHEGQNDNDTDTWAAAFQPTLPVIRSNREEYYGDYKTHHESEETSNSEDESDDDSEAARIRKRNRRIAKERSCREIKSSSIVATCGGNTVCLIDCRLGKIMAKYSHVEQEEFMCLAWTTLDHSNGDSEETYIKKEDPLEDNYNQSNILAAAGRMGSIKLINPQQNTCYKYLHGHTSSVVRLKFSLTNPRWLFTAKTNSEYQILGASTDGTVRLWDIGSLDNFQTEACCLARFVGLDETSVTAIGVSEKYLIVGTERGLMAQYNLLDLKKGLENPSRKSVLLFKPEKIYPPSQEWHESAVDEIIYIPYFSKDSYAAKKSKAESAKYGKKPRQKKQDDESDEDYEGEFVFASRENCQGEILVWEATESTESDAMLETILEWPITESWAKFTLAENITKTPLPENAKSGPKKKLNLPQKRQNILVAGTTDGKILMYDLDLKPKRARDGNIIPEKASNAISHPDSDELFRDVTISRDLGTIVGSDWSNRVFIWNYHRNLTSF
ncbi:Leucine-rich repeats and WD repeat domain-containing protein 1 [Entomortierella beljakovae]|nr:Leucine-rich repeats and WD repeat domain-containing protein 1 [Entomortierella beljakovae]